VEIVVMALLIVAVRGVEVEGQVAAETAQPIAVKLAQAIALAVREIAGLELAEIASRIATLEAVLGIEAASETVPDSTAEMPAPVVAGGLPAWGVRVGAAAELVVEVAAELVVEVAPELLVEVAAGRVVEVAAVGGSLGGVQRKISLSRTTHFSSSNFFCVASLVFQRCQWINLSCPASGHEAGYHCHSY
jgi:hypothetical protein